MQLIEGVEKALLRLLLAGDELNIIDQQRFGASVPLSELLGRALADGADVLIGKALGAYVNDVKSAFYELMGDRLYEMGLAEAGFRPDIQGVVKTAWPLSYGGSGGMREFI